MSFDSDPQQSVLPIGARDDIGRPVHSGGRVLCDCGRDVSDTQQPHMIERSHLSDAAARDIDHDDVPVFGWRCSVCSRVLALDPHEPEDDLEVGPPQWLGVEATLASGQRGHVLVPSEVVLR